MVSLAMVTADMLNVRKRYSLSDADLNALVQGTSISDSVINVAQYLIHEKLPHWDGFQDVLLGHRLLFTKVESPFIQILHVRNPDHWLTVTNVDADENTVFVYDSIDQGTPSDAIRQICHMLKLQSPTLTICTKGAQNQCNTLDCGLFAIANMYYLASDRRPENLNLSQSMLRRHLLKCMQKGNMEDFPLTSSPTTGVRPKDCIYELHCVCRQPLYGIKVH
ncbi:uncharacterized protein LOC142588536 [Dermacentor variabilis]|uniref:uncharacterized protein LOC142588536 n=1 Tax=Dermacentor variabilis TaxID=34621 RepID=UPI003F5AEDBC